MKLEVNEIYHNFIVRIVIFALFMYKKQIRQPNVFKQSVYSYVKKRLQHNIYLTIDTGDKISISEARDIIIDELLYDYESDYFKYVMITFRTPLKEVNMQIDLSDEEKYQNYLYM